MNNSAVANAVFTITSGGGNALPYVVTQPTANRIR